MQFAFTGTNRSGNAQAGVTTQDPESFTAAKFKAGWRELKVWVIPDKAQPVAEINPPYDTRHRTWWADGEIGKGDGS